MTSSQMSGRPSNLDPYESDWDPLYDADELDEFDDPHFHTSRDILARGNHPLGIAKGYVPRWKPGHAIREYYQNW